MALSQSITKNIYGKDVTFENCYLKISDYSGDKNNFIFSLNIYSDSSKEYIIDTKQFSITPELTSTKNFIQQGYEYVKINEYPDAVDLLDEEQTVSA